MPVLLLFRRLGTCSDNRKSRGVALTTAHKEAPLRDLAVHVSSARGYIHVVYLPTTVYEAGPIMQANIEKHLL